MAATASVSAHRRDEYLQAVRVAVEPARVDLELDLTPGISVADAVIAGIDGDRDGTLSAAERRAYVREVLEAVQLTIDGTPLRLQPLDSTFPELDALRRGEASIQVRSAVTVPRLDSGGHRLLVRNTHRPDVSVYLANALVPSSDRVAIAAQTRDAAQRELIVDYSLRAAPDASPSRWVVVSVAGLGLAMAFLVRRHSLPPPGSR
jgi:hypothetical protein